MARSPLSLALPNRLHYINRRNISIDIFSTLFNHVFSTLNLAFFTYNCVMPILNPFQPFILNPKSCVFYIQLRSSYTWTRVSFVCFVDLLLARGKTIRCSIGLKLASPLPLLTPQILQEQIHVSTKRRSTVQALKWLDLKPFSHTH